MPPLPRSLHGSPLPSEEKPKSSLQPTGPCVIFPNISLPYLLFSSSGSFCSSHTGLAVPTTCEAGLCLWAWNALPLDLCMALPSNPSGLLKFHLFREAFLTLPPSTTRKLPLASPTLCFTFLFCPYHFLTSNIICLFTRIIVTCLCLPPEQ